jgi:hypothetical protein
MNFTLEKSKAAERISGTLFDTPDGNKLLCCLFTDDEHHKALQVNNELLWKEWMLPFSPSSAASWQEDLFNNT